MGLDGNLETFYLSSLFQLLSNDKKTGRLRVTSDDDVVTVNFSDGTIVFATSTEMEKHLGYLLRSEGIIGDIELENYLLLARNRKEKLGKVLVDEGCISKEDLQHYVYMQTENILFGIFMWPKGKFRFEDCPVAFSEEMDTQFDTMELILEASRRVDELSVLQEQVPAKDQVLRYTASAAASGEKKNLSMQENSVLRLVNGARTVREIIHQSGYDEFTALKAIYTLMSCELVEVIEKAGLTLTANAPQPGAQPPTDRQFAGKDAATSYEQYAKISYQIQSLYEKNITPGSASGKKSRTLSITVLLLIIVCCAGAFYLYTTGSFELFTRKISEPAAEQKKTASLKPAAPEQPATQLAATQSLQDTNSFYFLSLPSGFISEDKSKPRKSHTVLSYDANVTVDIEARPLLVKWNAENEMYKEIADIQTAKTTSAPAAIESYALLSMAGSQGYKIILSGNINAVLHKTHLYRVAAYQKIISISVFCKDCRQHATGSLFGAVNEMIEKTLLIYP